MSYRAIIYHWMLFYFWEFELVVFEKCVFGLFCILVGWFTQNPFSLSQGKESSSRIKVKPVGKIWAIQVIELSKTSPFYSKSYQIKLDNLQPPLKVDNDVKNTSTLEKSDVEEVVLNAVCLVSSAGKTMPLTLFLPGNALWLLWWGWPWQNDHNDPREKHLNWHEPIKEISAQSSDNFSMC